MGVPELGTIQPVAIRDIWTNEASEFTPWLAENLELLGEALGMSLELIQREAPVGGFSLDILAQDRNTDKVVAIENQLEPTDHTHLGQIMTYAAGHDARTVIWITPHFRDEHRAAIDWLNHWTPEEIAFYGVEVGAIKIGNSLPAPEFRPVAFPNDWSKQAKQVSSSALSITGREKVVYELAETLGVSEFWNDVVAQFRQFWPYRPEPFSNGFRFYLDKVNTPDILNEKGSSTWTLPSTHSIQMDRNHKKVRLTFSPFAVHLCEEEFEKHRALVPFSKEKPNFYRTQRVSQQWSCLLNEEEWATHRDILAALASSVHKEWQVRRNAQ